MQAARIAFSFPTLLISFIPTLIAGQISGTITASPGGSPIPRATVTLVRHDTKPRQLAKAITDTEGRYRISDLPAGQYRIQAEKFGYLEVSYGADEPGTLGSLLTLAADEDRTGCSWSLWKAASISGTVRDEDGEPITGVRVMLYSEIWRRGRPIYDFVQQGRSDGSGQFRIGMILPGHYLLAADGRHLVQQRSRSVVKSGQTSTTMAYGLAFYPGVSQPDRALLLTLEPGAELRQVDMRLSPEPAFPLIVRTQAPSKPSAGKPVLTLFGVQAYSEIVPGNFEQVTTSMSADGDDIKLIAGPVVPGEYLLEGTSRRGDHQFGATKRVRVGANAPEEIVFSVEALPDLTGTVTIDGQPAPPGSLTVSLWQDGQRVRLPVTTQPGESAKFVLPVPHEGRWRLQVERASGGDERNDLYLKSVLVGTQNITGRDLVIGREPVGPLRIAVARGGGSIEGQVVDPSGKHRARFVILLPMERGEPLWDDIRELTTDADGRFLTGRLRPGTYRAFAFTSLFRRPLQDPGYLRQFEAWSETVQLEAGQHIQQTLRLIPEVLPQKEQQP